MGVRSANLACDLDQPPEHEDEDHRGMMASTRNLGSNSRSPADPSPLIGHPKANGVLPAPGDLVALPILARNNNPSLFWTVWELW
jgi:hypothetical protein